MRQEEQYHLDALTDEEREQQQQVEDFIFNEL